MGRALSCGRPCRGDGCLIEGATVALDITFTLGDGRVLLLWRAFPRGILGFRASRSKTAACRGFKSPPQPARHLGAELPWEFREPRCGSRGRAPPGRRPRARFLAPLREGAGLRPATT